jgi:hypothetical protein
MHRANDCNGGVKVEYRNREIGGGGGFSTAFLKTDPPDSSKNGDFIRRLRLCPKNEAKNVQKVAGN